MAELHEQANWLRIENEHLRTRLEADRARQPQEPPHPLPPSRPSKGKEVVEPDDVDLPADDELSSGSSPLPRRSPSPNAAEAHSRKRPPRRPSRSLSVARHRVRRELNRDQRLPTLAHRYVPDQAGGLPPPIPSMYPPFGACPCAVDVCSLRRSGTTGLAFHSPWTLHLGLRSFPRLFHTTLCHVRRFF